jgi:hypothetical protein
MVVEAFDEDELAVPCVLQSPLVATEAHARVMRRKRQPNEPADALPPGFGRSGGDER